MKKIGRKEFIKIGAGAAAGGLAGYVFSGAPFKGLQWLVEKTQDQLIAKKGPEKYLKALCSACGQNCEMSIRMIGNRAVMVETSNNGCPFGQNALQLLYHPERIESPLKRSASKGNADISSFKKITWEEAVDDISSRMNRLIEKKPELIAGINRHDNLSSALMRRLINAAGSPHVYYEPSLESLSETALGGRIEYDFLNTDLVLSFGARLFEGWGNPGIMNNAFIKWKKNGIRVIQIDALCTRTASLSDWLNIKPGTELFLAAGIANYLTEKKGKRSPDAAWSQTIAACTVDKAASITGVSVKRIEDIAEAFSRAKNPIAVAGRGGMGVSSSSAELAAIHTLNIMSGTKTARLKKYSYFNDQDIINKSAKNAYAGIDDFIKNGNPEMLFINEADPVYRSAYGKTLAKKMEKTFVVSITPLLNDSSMYADYILPAVVFPEDVLKNNFPLKYTKDTKHSGDMIISLAKKTGSINKSFPWQDYLDTIKKTGQTTKPCNMTYNPAELKARLSLLEAQLIKPSDQTDNYPLYLVPFELSFLGDGDGLAFPYVLKMIDSKTFSGGELWGHMNKITAAEYGITEGKYISIKSARGKTDRVRIHITGIVPPDTIAVPMGFGHKAYTGYAKGKGINFKEIMSDDIDPVTGTANWWITRVRI